jgi:hypothetical protein
MYATGIGLVIEGVERYIREKTKEGFKEPDKKKISTKEEKPVKKPKANGFLKRIQDWFEGDEA